MNRELFELYVETQLAPTLKPGDVIILDNLSSSYAGNWVTGFEKAAYRGG